MSIWKTLKETIVGIHADYHTGFERLKEKYGKVEEESEEDLPPEPSSITREFVKTMTGIGKSAEMREQLFGVDGIKRRAQPSPHVVKPDRDKFAEVPSSHPITKLLAQLGANGWTNLAVVPSYPGEHLMVQGNRGDEYGQYEVIQDSSGNITEVRTRDSVRKL